MRARFWTPFYIWWECHLSLQSNSNQVYWWLALTADNNLQENTLLQPITCLTVIPNKGAGKPTSSRKEDRGGKALLEIFNLFPCRSTLIT